MTTELIYLTWTAVLTGLIFVPYVLDRVAVRGIADTVGYPENPKPQSPWARRMKAAHSNAVENLAVFATLVLVAHVGGANNALTAMAAALYLGSRVVHLLAYTFAVPWLRTIAFAGGLYAQLIFAWRILTVA